MAKELYPYLSELIRESGVVADPDADVYDPTDADGDLLEGEDLYGGALLVPYDDDSDEAIAKEEEWPELPGHIHEALMVLKMGAHEVCKSDDDQQIVVGWASVITNEDGSVFVDSQEDILELNTIIKAEAEYMAGDRVLSMRHLKVGTGTDRRPLRVGEVIESFVVTPAAKEAYGLPENTPLGWMIAAHVENDAVWDAVKAGRLNEFSIGGDGVRVPVTDPLDALAQALQ